MMMARQLWALGVGLLASAAASAVDYAGTGTGAIPDNNSNGLNLSFNTTGFQGPLGHVRVALSINHTFVGDLRATLTSPNGLARLVLFARTGYKRSGPVGAQANLAGAYVFDDLLGADMWAATAPLTTAQTLPPGPYRTSTAGAVGVSDAGGCSTHLDLAFGGLSPTQAGGTWTLNVADLASGDSGSVNSATLTLNAATVMFASGFESGAPGPAPAASAAAGTCRHALFDFTGDGRSDFATVRNTGGGSSGAITWTVLDGGGGNSQSFVHGVASDSLIDGDFDGDGIDDAVAWRQTTGTFLVRRSSRVLDSLLEIPLGQTGDNSRNVGDYDGDGVGDATVFRGGAVAGAPSVFLIRLSSTGALRTLTAGESGAFPSGGIDLNGDNRADVGVQSNAGGGMARFRQFDGTSNFNFTDTLFGTPTDLYVTGNHAGNLRGDITVVRGVSGQFNWTTREAIGGAAQPTIVFGTSTSDLVLTGDYDGDGLDDYAVWRPSAMPAQSKFIIRRSTNTGVLLEVFAGETGDYPVANARVN